MTTSPPEQTPESPSENGPIRTSRRKLLGSLGAGALGVGAVVTGAPAIADAAGRRGRDNRDGRRGTRNGAAQGAVDDGPQRFTRLFDDHPPFQEADDELRIMLAALGAPGGLLDAKDPLEVGPIRLITEPELSPNNRDNPTHTAGVTFVGQFLDHDITNDAGSQLGRPTSLRRSTNLRTARFDLDSVYGGGPEESPELYSESDPFMFRIESGGLFEDLPRGDDGVAIIGDPRNDENMIISGIHVSFLKFHNAVLERERAGGLSGNQAFAAAQRVVRWHYQWLIVHEILPQFVGQTMVDDVLSNGPRFYTDNQARIPVEFQTSAYRFGHSMIRPSYRANLAGDNGDPFFALVFDPTQSGSQDPEDLAGGRRAPRRFIGWQTFFDFDDGEVKPNKRIDTSLSSPLFQLPMGTISTVRGEEIGPTSLATRNLLRHITWGIPSGQQVAQTMGVDRLSAADLSDVGTVAPPLQAATPLWLYILREADVMNDGLHLGPVGGRIVAEVFLGILRLDPASYLNAGGDGWSPTLPSRGDSGEFGMVDLLTIAGVDPQSRGQ